MMLLHCGAGSDCGSLADRLGRSVAVTENVNQISALLIGESSQGSGLLSTRLEARGCACNFAASAMDACAQLRVREFDLALSPLRLREVSLFPLIDSLEGSRTSLYYFRPVEEGCWWLPALRFGKKCFGSNALRPSEFIATLEQLIDEIARAHQPRLPERLSHFPTAPVAPRRARFGTLEQAAAASDRIAS